MADRSHVDVWTARLAADQVGILGPVVMTVGGREHPLVGIPARLVTFLSCSTDRWVSLDELIDSTWAGSPPASARSALHVHLGSIRRWMAWGGSGGPALEKSSAGYRVNLGRFELDYLLILDLLDQAHALVASAPDDAVEVLRSALLLERGALEGPTGGGSAMDAASQRLRLARLSGEEDLVEALLESGSIRSAEIEAVRLVEESPYREVRWAQLMRARYLDDRTQEALRTFGSARKVFVDELGMEPGPLLQGLERSVLMHDAAALAPLVRQPKTFSSVPSVAARIIGRETDLRRCVDGLLGHGTVVVHGPPGVGKTRLAQEMCRLADVERSVIWVDLRGHDDPVRALALTIGSPPDSSLSHLMPLLSGSPVLIVFDNAEHVGAPVEEVVPLLRSGLAELRVLVTSRVRLALAAAYLELKRLPVPAPGGSEEGFETNASVRLLRSAMDEFAPTIDLSPDEELQICELSAGLPLILRLVAGNLRTLGADKRVSLAEVAVGSQYAPVVMATLSLLPARRQHAYVSLSIIPGLFDVELGAAVVGLPVDEFLVMVGDLVDASLVDVVTGPTVRYQILPPLREVVLRQSLDDVSRGRAFDRLSDHAIAEARALADSLRLGKTDEATETRAAGTITVAVAALNHLVEVGDAERALELSSRLDPTLYSLGWWTEKNELLDRALAIPGPPTSFRARALTMRARAGLLSAFDLEALTTAEQIATDLREDMLSAYAAHLRGVALWWRGDWEGSLYASQSAADRFRVAGRWLEELEARKFIGLAQFSSGSVESGLLEQQEVLAGMEQLGVAFGIAHSLAFLGHCHRYVGDDEAAEVDLRESLEICHRIGNRATAIHVHLGLGEIAADRGDKHHAQRHASDALELAEQSRLNAYEPWAWTLAMRVALDTGDVDSARECARHALGALKFAPGGDAGRLALELAAMALGLDDPVRAARLVGAAQRDSEPREMPLPSHVERCRHLGVVGQIEQVLGDQTVVHVAAGRRCRVSEAAGGLVRSPYDHVT